MEAALTKEEFVRRMKIMTERSLCQMCLLPPSPPHAVKEASSSPPRYLVKREPQSPLRRVKEELTYHLRQLGVAIPTRQPRHPNRVPRDGGASAQPLHPYRWVYVTAPP